MKKLKLKNLIKKFESINFIEFNKNEEEGEKECEEINFNFIEIKINEMKNLITNELWKESSNLILNLKLISNFYFILNEEEEEKFKKIKLIKSSFPLNILISNLNLEIYLKINKFLKEIKIILKEIKKLYLRSSSSSSLSLDFNFLNFRNEIFFLFSNLEIFFYFDLILPKFEEFKKNLNSNLNFEILEELHSKYLNSIQKELFLNSNSIQNCFLEIFKISILFLKQKKFSLNLFQNFKKQSKLLFHFLSSIRNSLTQKLIFRLNFNNFFIE